VSILGGQRRCARNSGDSEQILETLAINTDAEVPSIRYELVDERQTLRIEVVDRTKIQIHREPRDGSSLALVHFAQAKSGALTLSIQAGAHPMEFEASSLWHLLLAEPAVCRQHLIPILQPLNPNWRLQESVERIEAALCRVAPEMTIPRRQISRLVATLDSSDFASRQAADGELRSMGVAVLPYLASLDRSQCTREQRRRMQRIRHDLSGQSPDSPERVASWLVNDEQLWRQWTADPNAGRRLAATQGLAGIRRATKTANESDRSRARRIARRTP